MSPRRRTNTAQLDATLMHVQTRLGAWRAERAQIAAEIRQVISHANALLTELSGAQRTKRAPAARSVKPRLRRGGRPKGFKVSAATWAKLRAAWTKRRAGGKESKAKAA